MLGVSNKLKLVLELCVVFLVLFYFVFHAIVGQNGLFSYWQIKKKAEIAACNLENLKRKKEVLERNTKLLSSKTLDPDILEERCRTILSYAYPEDTVVKRKNVR